MEGVARTGVGRGSNKYGIRVLFKNPGMTMCLITGVIDGRRTINAPIPLVIVVGDPEGENPNLPNDDE